MADITIVRIDETKSKLSTTQPRYVAVLSGAPDQTWRNNLASLIARAKYSDVMNVRVGETKPNEMTFDTKASADLEQVASTLKGWLAQLDSAEDQFKAKIREVNKKLFEPAT